MREIVLSRSLGTHDGTFHADEITACALLLLTNLIDKDKIVRSRDPVQLDRCEYVCDVGGVYNPKIKRFDHHQESYNGVQSSAGMILQYLYDEKAIDEGFYTFLKNSLIDGIDAIDNGLYEFPQGHCSFSQAISNFMPASYKAESEEIEQAFFRGLDFVFSHLQRLKDRYDYMQACQQYVADAMKTDKEYLVFHDAMPWLESFFALGGEKHQAKFLIMPTKEHWKLRAIPPSIHQKMQVRKPLPESWAGLLNQDLKKESGIDGAIFCHKGRFISVWETKEAAMQALDHALEEK